MKIDYKYSATVSRVVAGSVVELDIDLGFDVHILKKVRIKGADVIEKLGVDRGEDLIRKIRMQTVLVVGKRVIVETKPCKGCEMYVGEIYLKNKVGRVVSLSEFLK